MNTGQGDTWESLTDYVDYFGLTFPVLFDEDAAVYDLYRQQAAFSETVFPQDWIVDADGNIAYVNSAYEYDELVAALEETLD